MKFKEGIYVRGKQVKVHSYDADSQFHYIFDGTKEKYNNEFAKALVKAGNGGRLPYAIKKMNGDYFIEKELGKYELMLEADPSTFYPDMAWEILKEKLRKGEEVNTAVVQAVVQESLIPADKLKQKTN